MTKSPKDLDSTEFLLIFLKKNGTVQHSCKETAKVLYRPNLFGPKPRKDWDSTALLRVFLQKCCTVPFFFRKMSKNSVLSKSLWLLVTRRPHRCQKIVFCNKIGTVQHFCRLGLFFGQYSTFAGFLAKVLYCTNLFCGSH